jgi:HK97 family phage major capsid protein
MNINALQEKRQTLIATATEMANDEKSSVAEIKSVIAQADDCLARIDAIKHLGEMAPVAKQVEAAPAWKTFGSVKATEIFKGTFDESNYKAFTFGQYLLSLRGNAKATKWLKDNGHIKANNEGTESAGGYTVPVITNSDLIYLREQFGVVRQNSKIYPMTTDSTLVPNMTGSSTVYHVSENAAITTSDFTFDQVLLQTIKLGAVNPVSKELSEDTIIDYASMAARDFALKLATAEDTDCIMGDGTATYGGITGTLNTIFGLSATKTSIASLVVADAGSVAANKPTLANLRKMVAKAPMYPGANFKWYMHKQFWYDCVAPLLDALGGNSILDIANAYGAQPTLYGYPVVFAQVMPRGFDPTVTVTAKPLMMFADLALGTAFGDRRGITIEMSDQQRFLEDQYLYKATERFAFKCFDVGNVTATVPNQVAGAVIVLSQSTS